MLVEDEFMTRRMLKIKLNVLGHTVAGETNNANEAVSILESTKVDLAVLDINLGESEKDGIWLGEYIRFNKNIPFACITAFETADMKTAAPSTPTRIIVIIQTMILLLRMRL